MNEFDPIMVWARDVRQVSVHHVTLRLAVFVSPLGALVAGDQASTSAPATALVMLMIVLAAVTAALPDSHTALVVVSVLAIYWTAAVDDPGTVWALVAALFLLVFHTAAALASTTPARARLDPATVRRWAGRTGVVAVATTAIWALVAAAAADRSDASAMLIVVALVLVACFGWLLLRASTSN